MISSKLELLRAIALLLAANQGIIELDEADKALISRALGNHDLKEA